MLIERLAKSFSSLGRDASRMVLMSPCVVCSEDLPWLDRKGSICGSCWRGLEPSSLPACRACGVLWSTTSTADDFRCLRCITEPLPLDWIQSWGAYSGALERALHAFKFERHDFLSAPLATLLAQCFREKGDDGFDVVIPVPMHRRKAATRGYNQSELLARHFAKLEGLVSRPGDLRKVVDKGQQSLAPRHQRAENVRGVFEASDRVRGKRILLIDDICTTGETLSACARELLRKKAARVAALVVARA